MSTTHGPHLPTDHYGKPLAIGDNVILHETSNGAEWKFSGAQVIYRIDEIMTTRFASVVVANCGHMQLRAFDLDTVKVEGKK